MKTHTRFHSLPVAATALAAAFLIASAGETSAKTFKLTSPDGRLSTEINATDSLTFSVSLDGKTAILPSTIGLSLDNGVKVGNNGKAKQISRKNIDTTIKSPFYRAAEMRDNCNELLLRLDKNWNIVFRAYNDAIAYRFVTTDRKPFNIADETATYRFPDNSGAMAPYANVKAGESFERQFRNSFENTYDIKTIDSLDSRRLIFLPMVVIPEKEIKVCLTETALENYPGMYLNNSGASDELTAVFAPRPKSWVQGGHNELQLLVNDREDFIAKVDGPRAFPWRIAVVADNDAALAATNISYLLADPSRINDTSWIKPGKVAWDWWNAWNITGVDFPAGINNDTYKEYIDFAAKKGIEYVILDEGWSVNKKADLMQVVPEIDLPELVKYADSKGVGLILWAGYYAFDRDMENVCKHYADMGIKGFKVDFMDRDDQIITDFNYRAAETAAKYGLLLDLHGTSKPAGLNRTWPNVLNFEGVFGLEQMKWAPESTDMVTYDTQIPFIRQLAGPLDYTQGAMNNAVKGNYHPVYTEPMSQGTRCRQLALYMIFDSPFSMLCDSPSNYKGEDECIDFIAEVPTVWDDFRIIDGKIGDYIVTARRSGDTWYIGGITDWTPRDLELDLSFIGTGSRNAELYADGINAHRNGRDYKKTSSKVDLSSPMKIHLAPGGGFALKLSE